MLASVHTAIVGWDYFWAAIILLAAIVLEHVVPQIKWVVYTTLFLVALTLLTVCVKF